MMKLVDVPVEEILKDFFFCFSSDRDCTALRRSVSRSGILTPLYAVKTEKGVRLLSGFQRFRAAVDLSLEKVPVMLLDDHRAVPDIFLDILSAHVVCRSLNLVEKSKILRILNAYSVPGLSVYADFLSLLDLPDSPNILDEIDKILDLVPAVQDYIGRYDLQLKAVSVFHRLTQDEQILLTGLGDALQIRSVELTELIHLFLDSAGREGVAIRAVFQDLKIDALIADSQLTRTQKIGRMKEMLKIRRFPKLTRWNRELEVFRNGLKLPAFVQLTWDRNLEKPGIVMRAEIRSSEAFDILARRINETGSSKKVKQMLDVV